MLQKSARTCPMKLGLLFLLTTAAVANAALVSFSTADFGVHYYDTGGMCTTGTSTQSLFNYDEAVRVGAFVPLGAGETVGPATPFFPAPFITQGGRTIATTSYTCLFAGQPFPFAQYSISLYNEVAPDGLYPFSIQIGPGKALSEGLHYGYFQLVTNPATPGGGTSYVLRAWVEETAGLGVVVVPEPGAAALTGAAGAGLLRRGRRKRVPNAP
jgi:hypothetical protein